MSRKRSASIAVEAAAPVDAVATEVFQGYTVKKVQMTPVQTEIYGHLKRLQKMVELESRCWQHSKSSLAAETMKEIDKASLFVSQCLYVMEDREMTHRQMANAFMAIIQRYGNFSTLLHIFAVPKNASKAAMSFSKAKKEACRKLLLDVNRHLQRGYDEEVADSS